MVNRECGAAAGRYADRQGARADGVAVRGRPGFPERTGVANRIDLEEVLIVKPEPDHPRG